MSSYSYFEERWLDDLVEILMLLLISFALVVVFLKYVCSGLRMSHRFAADF